MKSFTDNAMCKLQLKWGSACAKPEDQVTVYIASANDESDGGDFHDDRIGGALNMYRYSIFDWEATVWASLVLVNCFHTAH